MWASHRVRSRWGVLDRCGSSVPGEVVEGEANAAESPNADKDLLGLFMRGTTAG